MNADYVELLSRPAPFASTSNFSRRIKALPILASGVAFFSVLLSAVLFVVTGKYSRLPGDRDVNIPTISRIGTYSPGCYVFSGGLHLGAIIALPIWWGVRLAQTQRLKVRTGLEKFDRRARAAKFWADAACGIGTAFSIFWFLAGSIPPVLEYDGLQAPQDKVHITVAILAYISMLMYSAITCFGVLAWARGVFLLSDMDIFWFRWKVWCFIVMFSTGILMAIAVGVQSRWFPDHVDCSIAWCREASIQAVGEYLIFPAGCLFMFSLKHDLANVHGNISVDRVYL